MVCSPQAHPDRIVQALYATALELGELEPQCPQTQALTADELDHLARAIAQVREHDALCPEAQAAVGRK